MKRVISLWFPTFATDRLSRSLTAKQRAKPHDSPLATVTAIHGGQRIAAANLAAQAAGVQPGMTLANARALYPNFAVHQADPDADFKALTGIVTACGRYTPWTSIDSFRRDGVWLDITGCAHLFGGEDALLTDLKRRLENIGYQVRAGLADTPGAAWALARFGDQCDIAAPRTERKRLATLPMAALRLSGETVEGLERMGLRRIGQLYDMPRAPLASRFGGEALRRLDQAVGDQDEPISPRRPNISGAAYQARLVFAEPIGRTEDVEAALTRLLDSVCKDLEVANQGARRLDLTCYRVDNSRQTLSIGASRPVRDPDHLARLFRDKLDDLDPGFGIEVITLAASETNALNPRQINIDGKTAADRAATAAKLIDRLTGRLGSRNVNRLRPHQSHLPERASREVSALGGSTEKDDWNGPPHRPPRPVQLLVQPLPIEVMAPVPDGPPVLFRWRRKQHKVARADGPERIAPEWWQTEGQPLTREVRDYYRLEDEDGQRYWVFREGLYRPDKPPGWYLHGFFA